MGEEVVTYARVRNYFTGSGGGGTGVLPLLEVTDKHFRINGAIARLRGFSGFPLIDVALKDLPRDERWVSGWTDLGYNYSRTWLYTPRKYWGDTAWDVPPMDEAIDVLRHFGERFGLVFEITITTDDRPDGYDLIAQWTEGLQVLPHVANELINEAGVKEKLDHIKACNYVAAGTRIWTNGCGGSGDFTGQFRGNYGVARDKRNPGDWARQPKAQLERWTGGGPDAPTDPAIRVPWLSDEPGKVQDVGTYWPDWRSFYGVASQMEAGAVVHLEAGKHLSELTADEQTARKTAIDAMTFFPDDLFDPGAYRHGQPEKDDEIAHGCVRTYGMKNSRVRVTPTDGAEILLFV